MKKILILCLLLFGCESFGVFNHEHGEGICITQKEYEDGASDYSCKDNITQEECLENVPGGSINSWSITTATCDDWN